MKCSESYGLFTASSFLTETGRLAIWEDDLFDSANGNSFNKKVTNDQGVQKFPEWRSFSPGEDDPGERG